MKKMVLVLLGVLFLLWTNHTSITNLLDFSVGSSTGQRPTGDLVLYGNSLYGMTKEGGDYGLGIIFKIATNGTGYSLLHQFMRGNNDGGDPHGSLIISGGTLYGMTTEGGASDSGTIFLIPAAVDSDFNNDLVTDLIWRHYTADGGNTVWLMSEATAGAGNNEAEGEGDKEVEGGGYTVEGEEGNIEKEDDNDIFVGAGYNPAQDDVADFYESLWPDGEGMSSEFPFSGFPGPFGTISVIANVPLAALADLAWKIVGTGDFNNDHKVDILWRFQGTGGRNQVWIMNVTARQSIVNIKAETNLNWQIAGVGDYNKDGKGDIIWRNYSAGGANRIWIMNNTAYVLTETLPAVADLNWKIEN